MMPVLFINDAFVRFIERMETSVGAVKEYARIARKYIVISFHLLIMLLFDIIVAVL